MNSNISAQSSAQLHRRVQGLARLALMAATIFALLSGTNPLSAGDKVALGGYDTVAYFTQNKAAKGKAEFSAEYLGKTWHCAGAKHRDLFKASPAKYAPQYGGYCAWAVSQGYTASTVPEAWKVVDGKLYLNFSRRIQRRWERDIPANIAAGDRNWPAALSA